VIDRGRGDETAPSSMQAFPLRVICRWPLTLTSSLFHYSPKAESRSSSDPGELANINTRRRWRASARATTWSCQYRMPPIIAVASATSQSSELSRNCICHPTHRVLRRFSVPLLLRPQDAVYGPAEIWTSIFAPQAKGR
jgi:hypothetical protein